MAKQEGQGFAVNRSKILRFCCKSKAQALSGTIDLRLCRGFGLFENRPKLFPEVYQKFLIKNLFLFAKEEGTAHMGF